MCFEIHVGYLPKNKDNLCAPRILILSHMSCSLQYSQAEALAGIDLCLFLYNPMKELLELTSYWFSYTEEVLGCKCYLGFSMLIYSSVVRSV